MNELTMDELNAVVGGEDKCTSGTGTITAQISVRMPGGGLGVLTLYTTPVTCGGTTVNVPGAAWGVIP